ncbi:hypothetical protein EDF32_0466 [Cellulomonas sp. PhB143]|nr:hypothetical protein EDF32_0466 [Cellulomonas sp. PhB143]
MLVAAVGAVAAYGLDPLPGLGDSLHGGAGSSAVRQVSVPAAEQVLSCPSGARLTDDRSVGDKAFDADPVRTTSTAAAAVVGPDAKGTFGPLDASKPVTLDAGPDAAVIASDDAKHPRVLVAQPQGGTGPTGTAAVASTTASGDLRGLAAASCTAPSINQWLVGGSTELGSSSRLVLQNPGSTAASVSMTVFGPTGEVTVGGSDRFVVPPQGEVETLVEAGVPDQERVVVHVESEGGLVSAYLQHSTVGGIVAQGVDDVTPGSGPTTSLAVAGVVSAGEAVGDDHAPRLRLLAPDGDPVTATVRALGPDGEVAIPGAEKVSLDDGVVQDVGLGGLPAGTYTVVVDADGPVVGGAWLSRAGTPDPDSTRGGIQYDQAWLAASDLTRSVDAAGYLGSVALPEGVHGVVGVGAVGDEDVAGTLTAYGTDGAAVAERAVSVKAGRTATVDVADLAKKAAKDAKAPRVAAVSLTADGGDDARAVWGVSLDAGPQAPHATKGDPGSFVSALAPVLRGPGERDVSVRETETVGGQSGAPEPAPEPTPTPSGQ